MLRRLKSFGLGVLVLFGYFWTGAAAKLWLLSADSGGFEMPPDLHARPYRGQPLLGVNAGYKAFMSVYGPVPLGPLFGPGTGTFLQGLGAGLDPGEVNYDERRRQALERNLRIHPFNPWRGHARLELAALDAFPRPLAENMSVMRPEDWAEPAWVTVGLVDQDRWWITRQPTGPDVRQAEQLCTETLKDRPAQAVAAQALSLRANLEAERWDFRAEAADLKELALEHPVSPLANSALSLIAQDAAMGGRMDEAIALFRHVMRNRLPGERARLAIGLASLQAQSGEVENARATLREAQREVDREAAVSGSQGRDLDLDRQLRDSLRGLEGRQDAPAPLPPGGPGPGAPVRTRLLAAGKPIAGVLVALVPLAEAFQSLPPPASLDAANPRAAGTFSAPARQSFGMGWQFPRWNTPAVGSRLKRQPSLLARSDAHGEVRWLSVRPGAYALFIRVGTWQLPGRGRDLAPVPTRAAVVVTGSEQAIPEVHFAAPIRLTMGPRGARLHTLHWSPVSGAARYRVALRDSTAERSFSPEASEAGAGSPGIDPQVVWWRDGVTGTAAQLTAAQFVGPAADPSRSGLLGGRGYSWYVEAIARDGAVLATSETLAGPDTFGARTWTALRPPPDATKRRPRRQTFPEPGTGPPAGPGGFASPFLEGLIRGRQPAAVQIAERPPLPPIDSKGHGLPPRAPLRLERGAPASPPGGLDFGNGTPPRLPPQLLARLRGQMPPMGAGAPPDLPPQLLAQLRRGPPPGFGFGSGSTPPRLPVPRGRSLARIAGRPMAGVPADAFGRPVGGQAPALPPGTRLPGSSRLQIGPGGTAPGPDAVPRQPRRALDLSARIRQPELVSVELEPFGPGSESRWRAEASGALTAAGRDGLLVRGAVILHPASPAPALPAGARRIALHLTGGRARVELRLRNSSGMEQTVRMMPPLGANSPLAAPLPEGAWSLSTMTVAPEDDAEIRLSALIAEAIPAPGAYATAWKQGELLLVRIYNLGETTEHVALESAPAATLAEADLAPRGQAYVRVPVAGFPGSVHPPVLWLVRSGGRVAVPVE